MKLFAAPLTLFALLSGTVVANPIAIPDGMNLVSPNLFNVFSRRADGCTVQTFTGTACNGAKGAVVAVNGRKCISNGGRHSLRLGPACPLVQFIAYKDANCKGDPTVYYAGPGCYHIVTGEPWRSTFLTYV